MILNDTAKVNMRVSKVTETDYQNTYNIYFVEYLGDMNHTATQRTFASQNDELSMQTIKIVSSSHLD